MIDPLLNSIYCIFSMALFFCYLQNIVGFLHFGTRDSNKTFTLALKINTID